MGQREQPGDSRGQIDFTQTSTLGSTGTAEGVVVSDGLRGVSPAAARYASARPLPKQAVPLGQVPMPPIPALGQKVGSEPRTMADYAAAQQQLPAGVSMPVGGGIIQPGTVPVPPAPINAHDFDIRPTDMLPPAAKQDPQYMTGTGSDYASAQPHLAVRYGVLRNGAFVSPQGLNLRNPKGGLSPSTVEGLNALGQAQRHARDAAQTVEAAVPPPPPAESSSPTLVEEATRKAISEADSFQLQEWMKQLARDDLNNPQQRELIEKRLRPVTIDELIVKGYCEQRIPIVPDKFEITLRSTDPETELALKRLAMEDTRVLQATDQYYLDRYSYYGVVAALTRVNDIILPPYQDSTGAFSDELFKAKAQRVLRYPMHMIASIGVQVTWFDQRVRRLFRVEELGNG